jgi:leucine dehydrogenase
MTFHHGRRTGQSAAAAAANGKSEVPTAMNGIDHPEFDDHEEIIVCRDPASGLHAIIAVHDTSAGPAAGGCRMWPYADESAALADVLRLSRAMTYKTILAELPFGGGKSVIIGDPRRDKTPARLAAFARQVDALGGRYIVGEDVGTTLADMDRIALVTRHVAGTSDSAFGDPAPATAWGVFHGMRAAVRHATGDDNMNGAVVAVQGVGSVGFELCRLLRQAGAKLLIADVDDAKVRKAQAAFGATAVSVDALLRQRCDILAPCAMGGILNDLTIPEIRAKIIAGASNNQLAEPRHGTALADRKIVYAPDFVINAGGVTTIAGAATTGFDRAKTLDRVAKVYDRLMDLFQKAANSGQTPAALAESVARERLAALRAAASRNGRAKAAAKITRRELQPSG